MGGRLAVVVRLQEAVGGCDLVAEAAVVRWKVALVTYDRDPREASEVCLQVGGELVRRLRVKVEDRGLRVCPTRWGLLSPELVGHLIDPVPEVHVAAVIPSNTAAVVCAP